MLKYLKEAFWASPHMPGLGHVPVNALAVAAFGIFGFAESWIWLVGLGLERTYLYACFTSERFRRLVDAKELVLESAEATKKKTELVASLTPPRRDRLRRLEARCGRILQSYRQTNVDSAIAEANEVTLKQIAAFYLRLLLVEQNLAELEAETSEPSLRKQIETLENALKETALSESGRESKAATLHILEKRLANLSRGRAVMDEVCSDLQRLEAKVELALENARMGRGTEIIATEIDMNRPFLEDNLSDFTSASASYGATGLGAESTEQNG
jgi:hypothetical protein